MENIKATGVFHVDVIHAETGKVLESFSENNLVVSLGRTNIARLLGGDTAGKKISKIACGSNGTDPSLADTALIGMFSKAISGVDYPESNSVRINWAIDATEANGITIREFGLLNDDNVLCARKVRTDIVKTSSVRLVGTWKLTIN